MTAPPPDTPAETLPAAEARRRYLIYVGVRVAGLIVMGLGVWLGRRVGEAPGLIVVLLGGCTMLVRPRHLGLTRRAGQK
jgi:hypothetical protein